MKRIKFLSVTTCCAAALTLAACGGGGTSAAVAPAPATSDNQLTARITSLPNFESLALTAPTSTQVAVWEEPKSVTDKFFAIAHSITNKFFNILPTAIAQTASGSGTSGSNSSTVTSTSCNVKRLVGAEAGGTETEISLITGVTDECVGVTDMFDGLNYILLATEGIYSGDKVCNIVFAQKSTGNLYCLGETQRSRYSFSRKSGNNWKKYDILQATENGSYIFLEAKVDVFSDAGEKTGELIKILRFDLTDAQAGPTVKTVLEGENTAWYNWNSSGDTSYFEIFGYSGLENGDIAASYQISLYNNSFNQWAYNSKASYFRYEPSTSSFGDVDIDFTSLGTSSNSWWDQIRCYLKSGEAGFNFVAPNSSALNTLFKGEYRADGTIAITPVGSTQLCQDWNPASIAKAGSKYFGVAQNSQLSNWTWSGNGGTGNLVFDIFTRDVTQSSDTAIAQIQVSRDWANPTLKVSADGQTAIVALGAYEKWGWNSSTGQSTRSQFGAEIFKVDLASGTNTKVLDKSENIWISAISNFGSDGSLSFSARDLSKALFDKVNAVIESDGTLNTTPAAAASQVETYSVIKL